MSFWPSLNNLYGFNTRNIDFVSQRQSFLWSLVSAGEGGVFECCWRWFGYGSPLQFLEKKRTKILGLLWATHPPAHIP